MEICVAYSDDGKVWRAYNDGKPVFMRGADTYLCLQHTKGSTYVIYGRSEFSTELSWREIRGVNVASGELNFAKDAQRFLKATPSPTPGQPSSPASNQ